MNSEAIIAMIGAVYEDGVSLILPGASQATLKHYKVNAACPLKAGDRVKVSRIGSSYLVDYRITGKPTAEQATVLIDSTLSQAGQAADAAAVGSGLEKLEKELTRKTEEIERALLTNANETERELSQKADKTQLCNPNLLDNWYFGNPVNQRGETSYSGAASYGFDRWRTNFSSDIVEKTDNGIKNVISSTERGWHLHQRLEIDGNLAGQKIQASALITGLLGAGIRLAVSFRNSGGNEITAANAELKNGLVSFTTTIPENCAYIYFGLFAYTGVMAGDFAELSAAKLELGSSQTLAHQEIGTWVLNGITDYTLELLKCQRREVEIGSRLWNPNTDTIKLNVNYARFVAEMNALSAEIGASDAYYCTANGYPRLPGMGIGWNTEYNSRVSANALLKTLIYAYHTTQVKEIMSTVQHTFFIDGKESVHRHGTLSNQTMRDSLATNGYIMVMAKGGSLKPGEAVDAGERDGAGIRNQAFIVKDATGSEYAIVILSLDFSNDEWYELIPEIVALIKNNTANAPTLQALLGEPYPPKVAAVQLTGKTYYDDIKVVDAGTSGTCYRLDADAIVPSASTAKIMACCVATRYGFNCKLTQQYFDTVGGSGLKVDIGSSLDLMDAMYAMMLQSDNDLTNAIARVIGGYINTGFVGGRNLLPSSKDVTIPPWEVGTDGNYSSTDELGHTIISFPAVDILESKKRRIRCPDIMYSYVRNKPLVLSFDMRSTVADEINNDTAHGIYLEWLVYTDSRKLTYKHGSCSLWLDDRMRYTKDWTRHHFQFCPSEAALFKVSGNASITSQSILSLRVYHLTKHPGEFKDFKLEFGSTPSDWSE